ncbi:MAG: hypothetical protein SGILL_006508 [Bacillariaceae sp.]
MWKAEHLPGTGINGLLWEQREFPDGGSYYFSPVLGQLRLSLSDEPVRGGVLADEMGLGKTCSVLALILASLPDIKREVSSEKKDTATSATLIVVPPALLSQWVTEVAKVAGDSLVVDVFDHHGLEFIRRSSHPSSVDADIVLTTYRALDKGGKGSKSNKGSHVLLSTKWARVVLDEMQEVRSHTSSVSKNCIALDSTRRWMLSGTPLFEGFSDLRGELAFLRLDPFGADSEDGFFRFAVEQHLENRSRFGLETLRVLSLVLLRRSKSMIVKATGLPLLGLKPMAITFRPVSQDPSERAVYVFLEHLMHSVMNDENQPQNTRGRKRDKASGQKRSFLRMLRDVCGSLHLLNGGLGCQSQLRLLDTLMKAYNRTFVQEKATIADNETNVFTCDEAIRFISQAEDQMNVRSDFVTDARMGHGGGVSMILTAYSIHFFREAYLRVSVIQVASRSRATIDKYGETLEVLRDELSSKNSRIFVMRRKLARLRWWKALELVTTGHLSDSEYGSANKFYAALWKARRTSRFGHGWRPRSKSIIEPSKYLEVLHKRGFDWANPSALQCLLIPNEVSEMDLKESVAKWTGGDSNRIQIVAGGPREGSSHWSALVLLGHNDSQPCDECSARLMRSFDDIFYGENRKKTGLKVKASETVPHIEAQFFRAKLRFETAEAMVVVYPSEENISKRETASRAFTIARHGLRGFAEGEEYKEGHVLVRRAFLGFRLQGRPREMIIDTLNKSIEELEQAIEASLSNVDAVKREMGALQVKQTSNLSEKFQGLTAVEELQALQNGRAEDTTCPACQEPLGDTGGLVAATQCGHLSCSGCMKNWRAQKPGQLTCMECRKPVHRVITIDPTLKEDEEAIAQRKKDARHVVQKAAKLLKENGSGVLDPRVWQALYETIELPESTDKSRDRKFPAIPGDLLGHLRTATNLPVNFGPKVRVDPNSVMFSSKVRALLSDLPKDELSVVFTSSKSLLMHLLEVFELNRIGCRALYTGQSDDESRNALDEWHNNDMVPVLVVQAGAAACGLTLTAASKLFLMEPFLKYEEEQQAYARLHRYGQTKEVVCSVYYTPVSIESRLLEWRKNSNDYAPEDEEINFAPLKGLTPDDESDGDFDSDEEEAYEEDANNDEDDDEENQTNFLLNLQSS